MDYCTTQTGRACLDGSLTSPVSNGGRFWRFQRFLTGFLTVLLGQIRPRSRLASEQNEWSAFYLHCFSGLIMNERKVVRRGEMKCFCSGVALHKWTASSHFSYTRSVCVLSVVTLHSSQWSRGYRPPFSIRERPTGAEATKQDELGSEPIKHTITHTRTLTHNLDIFVAGWAAVSKAVFLAFCSTFLRLTVSWTHSVCVCVWQADLTVKNLSLKFWGVEGYICRNQQRNCFVIYVARLR